MVNNEEYWNRKDVRAFDSVLHFALDDDSVTNLLRFMKDAAQIKERGASL